MQSINQYAKLWNNKPSAKDEPRAVQRTASIMEFQQLYQKFSIRSVESVRYAAVCYYTVAKIGDAVYCENPKGAMQYLRYLEHIVRDRADDPSGTFVCKLQKYREVLSQIDQKYRPEELKQACNAFVSGDYETLEQLRKPRLLDGRQVVDIELRAMVETMISLWGKDYDQLTPAQALQYYAIYLISLSAAEKGGILNSKVMNLVQLFLEDQADTEEEGYSAVSAWMKEKYAGDDAALAESRNEIGPILTHASKESKKHYALMRGDRKPSGISEDEWEELKQKAFLVGYFYPINVGYELLSSLSNFRDPRVLHGLSERYPYDPEIQEELDDLNARHPDWKTNPAEYRGEKLHAWHMECARVQRRYAAQYAKPQQQQQQISHEYPIAQEYSTPQPVQQQASYHEYHTPQEYTTPQPVQQQQKQTSYQEYTTPQPVQQQTSYQEYTTPQPVQQQTSYQEASLRSSYQDGYNSVQQSKKIQQDQPNKGEKPCCVVF